jgi:C4-dicarboxylate transporter DctQ subunit
MFNRLLNHLEELLVTLLMGGATVIIFLSVAHRYLSGYAIPGLQDWLLGINVSWAQELCIIMFVWMAKFGAAYGVRTGIHVGVDVLINRMGDRLRARFILFGLAAGALFTGTIATLGAHFVWENGAHYGLFQLFGLAIPEGLYEGPTTPDLEWPTWIVYSAIPLGSSLMCLRFLQVAWTFLRTGELPHHDHGHVDGLDEHPQVDVNPYGMADNLHMHDLKHHQLGEDERPGDRS